MRIASICLIIASIVAWMSFLSYDVQNSVNSMTVQEVLSKLGDKTPNGIDQSIEGFSAEIGYDIVHHGFSDEHGKKAKKQSKHFVCTSCHNVEKEDPDLRFSDPEERLRYTNERELPFLQGTTLYGAVDRTTFYNGDYEQQYGALVKDARYSIRNAIQLCATECAKGRALDDWEIESIMAYLWTIGLKMSDLHFTEQEYQIIQEAMDNEEDVSMIIEVIKRKYLSGSPADFSTPPQDRKIGYAVETINTDNGKLIYENSCLHCHQNRRYSYLHLDDSKLSMKWLSKKADGYSRHSMYQVIRYGVESFSGKRSYMPKYPDQKMSDQQVEDLKAYFKENS